VFTSKIDLKRLGSSVSIAAGPAAIPDHEEGSRVVSIPYDATESEQAIRNVSRRTGIGNNHIQPIRHLLHLLHRLLVTFRIIGDKLDHMNMLRVLLGELIQLGGLGRVSCACEDDGGGVTVEVGGDEAEPDTSVCAGDCG
jgi:hypothetical protein